ncbi:type IV pilus assembly protein PilM [Patescibacteria group bacterium]
MPSFFTLKPKAFGLDISDSSFKIANLKKKGGSLGLASFGISKIKEGIIEGGEIKNEKAARDVIKKSLQTVSGKKIKTDYVVASLPEEKSFLQVIQMPLMKEEELEKSVYFEAENHIPLPVNEVYLDWQIVQPIYDHLDHLDVLIVAFPKKIVDSYVRLLRNSGLKIKALEIESSATTRALIKNMVSPHPVLLIDLGANATGFMIFSGYSLRFTSFSPISSNQFTKVIADSLSLTFKEAEGVKIKHGLSKKYKIKIKNGIEREVAPGKIFDILLPQLTDLTKEIEKYLEYYRSHVFHEHLAPGSRTVEKVILCGGGANLKGLSQFLSTKLKVSVEVSNPWTNIFKGPISEIPGLSFAKSQEFSCVLGLALRGITE